MLHHKVHSLGTANFIRSLPSDMNYSYRWQAQLDCLFFHYCTLVYKTGEDGQFLSEMLMTVYHQQVQVLVEGSSLPRSNVVKPQQPVIGDHGRSLLYGAQHA
jgi:hypothetical protein